MEISRPPHEGAPIDQPKSKAIPILLAIPGEPAVVVFAEIDQASSKDVFIEIEARSALNTIGDAPSADVFYPYPDLYL